jgi:secreted PhoX family phosphatase
VRLVVDRELRDARVDARRRCRELNATTGAWTPTPQFGHIQHENIVPVERVGKFMVVTTDDDFRIGSPSRFLAYIADSLDDAIAGNGQLYVWKATNPSNTPSSIRQGDTIPGEFVPLTQAENANSITIKTAARAKGAFPFSRLEDGQRGSRRRVASTSPTPARSEMSRRPGGSIRWTSIHRIRRRRP